MELRSPRRIVTALVLGLLLGAGSIGVVGAASADDGFDIPARRAGDHVEYTSDSRVEKFDLLPRRVWKDEAGVNHLADIMEFEVGKVTFNGRERPLVVWTAIDTTTYETLASSRSGSASQSWNGGPLGDSSAARETRGLVFGLQGWVCGLIHDLQGASGPRLTAADCGDGPMEFKRDNSMKGVVYVHEGDTRMELHMGDTPYPERIVTGAGEDAHVATLTAYAAGAKPLGDVDLPTSEPLPTIQMAPVDWYGPASGGIDAAYPLRQAVDEAVGDLTLRELQAFLNRHPDWIVLSATMTQSGPAVDWRIRLAAEAESVDLYLQRGPSIFHDLPGVAGTPLAWSTSRTEHVSPSARTVGDLPATAPVAASVQAAWQVYANSADAAPSWSFDMPSCRTLCSLASMTVGFLGDAASDDFDPIGDLTRPSVDSTETGVALRYVGEELYSVEITEVVRRESAGPLATQAPEQSESRADNWVAPGAVATGSAAFVSVLVSLLYWLWPTLRGLPMFGLFHRKTGASLLDHPVRKALFGHVSAEPGVHYQALVRASGKGQGNVEHHLRRMEQAGLLSVTRTDGYSCYFAKGAVDRRAMAAAGDLRSDGAKQIFQVIQETPGTTVTDVATATGLSPGTVAYHLRRLRTSGAVIAERNGRSVNLRAAAWI